MKLEFTESCFIFDESGRWFKIKLNGMESYQKATKFVESQKKCVYDAVIEENKKRRSIDANAYFWLLCDKLACVLGLTKEEVYKEQIQKVGVFDSLQLDNAALDRFSKTWQSQGIGWLIEKVSQDEGKTIIHAYYGSSSYNSKEMCNLINNIVYECKQINIETMTPDELDQMLGRWNKKGV